MASEHKIVPAPIRGINLSVPEQTLFPELGYARDIVNMLPTKNGTLKKRPGYRYLSSIPEGTVPIDLFEFGAIGDRGLVPAVVWIGHRKAYLISKLLLFPNNLAATSGPAQATLDYDPVNDADGYDIQYKETTAEDWTDVSGMITGTSHTITGLTNGTEYQFRVRSRRTLREPTETVVSHWSPAVTATPVDPTAIPAPPSVFSETSITHKSFLPGWNAVEGAEDYNLRYREGTTGPWTEISGITELSRLIEGLSADRLYQWQVNAGNVNGDSGWAPVVPREVTTLELPLRFVAGLRGFTITLGDWTSRHAGGTDPHLQWEKDIAVPADVVTGGASVVMESLSVRYGPFPAFMTLNPATDLLSSWEDGGVAMIIQIGDNMLELPGPNYSGNTQRDASAFQNYEFIYSQAVRDRIAAFNTAIGSASQSDRDATTLTFVIDPKVYKSEDGGTTWDSGTDLPETPEGFSVDEDGLWTLLGASGRIYEKGSGDFGEPADGPAGVTGLKGITGDDDGNKYTVSADTLKFYQRTGITWSTGIDLPDWMTDPQGIAWDDEKVYVLDRKTRKYGTYSDGMWDNGTDIPAAATDPRGIDVRSGEVFIGDNATDKVYRRDGNAWDAGVSFSTATNLPRGLAVSGESLT